MKLPIDRRTRTWIEFLKHTSHNDQINIRLFSAKSTFRCRHLTCLTWVGFGIDFFEIVKEVASTLEPIFGLF